MKQKLFLFLLFSMTFCGSFAQSMDEVVYLKNGSAIRGTVIEQVPGESVKIKTSDGSIFVYKMSEIEKITKEEKTKSKTKTRKKEMPQKGYKGFVDIGYNLGVGSNRDNRIELTTTHGYQFFPYLFAGMGTGVSYWFGGEEIAIPIFANIRGNLPVSSFAFSPFADIKLGYSPYDLKGLYGNFSIGCRFSTGGNCGINLSVGYQIQKDEIRSMGQIAG